MSNPLRDEFNAYWIARQRAKGYGTELSDAEMISHPHRQDAEFESWLEGRRFAVAATESPLLQALHNELYRAQRTESVDVLTDAIGKARLLLARYREALVPDDEPTAKQKKLMDLANRIDYEELWRWAGMDHDKMTAEQKDRMNAGVALRRYAHLWAPGRWVVFPPEGPVHFSASTLDKAYEMAKGRAEHAETCKKCNSPNICGQLGCATASREEAPTASPSNWLWRHKKSGGLYRLIGGAKLQTDKPLSDMAEVEVYRGEDGVLWVRAAQEFKDRFERAQPIVDEARKLEKREGDHTI